MRLWSVHPRHLDPRGLVALWREGLLALHVLNGRVTAYGNHPQLLRFRQSPDAVAAINAYMSEVLREADARGYSFDSSKIRPVPIDFKLPLTDGQLDYEREHLLRLVRNPAWHSRLSSHRSVEPHPIFHLTPGEPADWEKTG